MTSAPETTDAAWRAELDRLAADRALGPFLSGQGAVLVIAADGATVLHANAAGQALAKRGWTEQGRKRLAKLVDGLAPFAGLRLERLEFDGTDGPLTLTCACRRLRGHAQAPLLVATLQVPEALAVRPAEPREAAPEAMAAEPRAGTAADEPAAEAAPPALAPAWPERLRLVWRTDAGGAITAMAPEAARLLGRDLIGARWADLIGTSVADPDGRLAAALAGEATWNALPVLWRLEQGPEAIAVQMSASPLRGPAAPSRASAASPSPGRTSASLGLRRTSPLRPRLTRPKPIRPPSKPFRHPRRFLPLTNRRPSRPSRRRTNPNCRSPWRRKGLCRPRPRRQLHQPSSSRSRRICARG